MTNAEIAAQYAERAAVERAAGGSVEIGPGWVSVTLSDGSEYFFQGEEGYTLVDEAERALDGECIPEDYILAQAQNW
jgi:D-lyxose ketol-isomerase